MEKWEYWTGFIWANMTKEAKEFIQQKWPNWNPPKFTPQTMIPELNSFGQNGWELVHMEPVPKVGSNADVGFPSGGEGSRTDWSNAYFCVFKRRLEK